MSSSAPSRLAQGLGPGYGTQPQYHTTTLATIEPSSHMSLGDLPAETVLQIVKDIGLSDKYHLMSTCKGMYALIRDIIYTEDLSSPEPRALRWACAHGLISIIYEMLDSGMSVDHVFGEEACVKTTSLDDSLHGRDHACTPLSTAVAFRQLEAVEALLERHADANFAPTAAETEWSSDKINIHDFNRLYKKGMPSVASFRPLHWAVNPQLAGVPRAQRRNENRLTEQIVDTLIASAADMEGILSTFPCLESISPMTVAFANIYTPVSVLRILNDAGAPTIGSSIDEPEDPFLFLVRAWISNRVKNGKTFLSPRQKKKLEFVLSRADSIETLYIKYFPELCECAPTPDMLETARIFLRYTDEPDIKTTTKCLISALNYLSQNWELKTSGWKNWDFYHGYEALFTLLIENGAELESTVGRYFKCFEDIAEKSEESEEREEVRRSKMADSALTALCRNGFDDEFPIEPYIEFFLSEGASPTGRDYMGYSALHYASAYCLTRAAAVLLSAAPLSEMVTHGSLRDVDGMTARPMLITVCDAYECGDLINTRARFAELLIKSGAAVNVLDRNQHSPLTFACRKGDAQLVRVLLRHGADPNFDPAPCTPLVVVLSIYSGNSPFIYCLDGTPLCKPRDDESMTQIVEMLLNHGANWTREEWDLSPLLDERSRSACPRGIMALLRRKLRR
ncbi:ankyrin repeat-containing domain protein [Nemania diffusa]|nr:ankyrin repeat-containing domain protein [Nemania diffusa]